MSISASADFEVWVSCQEADVNKIHHFLAEGLLELLWTVAAPEGGRVNRGCEDSVSPALLAHRGQSDFLPPILIDPFRGCSVLPPYSPLLEPLSLCVPQGSVELHLLGPRGEADCLERRGEVVNSLAVDEFPDLLRLVANPPQHSEGIHRLSV